MPISNRNSLNEEQGLLFPRVPLALYWILTL
jgi:hypothetical protein